jgi:hypothetical protein
MTRPKRGRPEGADDGRNSGGFGRAGWLPGWGMRCSLGSRRRVGRVSGMGFAFFPGLRAGRSTPGCQCAVEGAGLPWGSEENPPGNFRSAGSNRSRRVWQRARLKPLVQKVSKEISESTGRTMSEHRASLEKGNANADPVDRWRRLPSGGKRAKRAPREFAGVVVTACGQQGSCDNTGNPPRREVKTPDQQPARDRLGRGGWRRGSFERRSRVTPVGQRSLSSRTMTEEGKTRRLA